MFLKFCRNHPIILTAVYSLLPAIVLMLFVRFPEIDVTTVEGWKTLFKPAIVLRLVIAIIVWTWSSMRFIKFFLAWKRMQNTNNDCENSYMTLLIGAPGTGKTASGTQISYDASLKAWRKLQFERACQFSRLDHYNDILNDEKSSESEKEDARYNIAYYEFLDKSYKFFAKHEDEFIPCFLSSNPIWDKDGRMSYKYESKYVTEHTLLPAFSIVFCDEIGYEEGSDKSRELPPDFATWYRYHRQFGDYKIYGTDQDSGAVCIQARRCTDNNRALYKQNWVLQPKLLITISDFFKNRANKYQFQLYDIEEQAPDELLKDTTYTPFHKAIHNRVNQKQIDFSAFNNRIDDFRFKYDSLYRRFLKSVKVASYVESVAKCIGFRQIKYFDEGNTERSLNPFKGRGYMVFPCSPSCFYDDHASLTLNPALFKDVQKLEVNDVDIDAWDTHRYRPTDRPLPTKRKVEKPNLSPKTPPTTE